LFGKRAESLTPFLLRGTSVTVCGNVTEREYEKDGRMVKSMDVRVSDVALQGGKRDVGIPAHPASSKAAPAKGGSGFDDMDEGDIPF